MTSSRGLSIVWVILLSTQEYRHAGQCHTVPAGLDADRPIHPDL